MPRKNEKHNDIVEGYDDQIKSKLGIPTWAFILIIVALVALFLFMLKKHGSKAGFSCGMSDMSGTDSQDKWSFRFY